MSNYYKATAIASIISREFASRGMPVRGVVCPQTWAVSCIRYG